MNTVCINSAVLMLLLSIFVIPTGKLSALRSARVVTTGITTAAWFLIIIPVYQAQLSGFDEFTSQYAPNFHIIAVLTALVICIAAVIRLFVSKDKIRGYILFAAIFLLTAIDVGLLINCLVSNGSWAPYTLPYLVLEWLLPLLFILSVSLDAANKSGKIALMITYCLFAAACIFALVQLFVSSGLAVVNTALIIISLIFIAIPSVLLITTMIEKIKE